MRRRTCKVSGRAWLTRACQLRARSRLLAALSLVVCGCGPRALVPEKDHVDQLRFRAGDRAGKMLRTIEQRLGCIEEAGRYVSKGVVYTAYRIGPSRRLLIASNADGEVSSFGHMFPSFQTDPPDPEYEGIRLVVLGIKEIQLYREWRVLYGKAASVEDYVARAWFGGSEGQGEIGPSRLPAKRGLGPRVRVVGKDRGEQVTLNAGDRLEQVVRAMEQRLGSVEEVAVYVGEESIYRAYSIEGMRSLLMPSSLLIASDPDGKVSSFGRIVPAVEAVRDGKYKGVIRDVFVGIEKIELYRAWGLLYEHGADMEEYDPELGRSRDILAPR